MLYKTQPLTKSKLALAMFRPVRLVTARAAKAAEAAKQYHYSGVMRSMVADLARSVPPGSRVVALTMRGAILECENGSCREANPQELAAGIDNILCDHKERLRGQIRLMLH